MCESVIDGNAGDKSKMKDHDEDGRNKACRKYMDFL